ncbi:MAG: hypothetical protein KDC84_06030 [Crocinitomicaceae bacterium]|nr:hypothetical protein [Crocinitomicaceae bacterium]
MKYLLIFPFFIFAFSTFSQQDFPKNNLIIHMDPGVGNILIDFSGYNGKSEHNPWFGFAAGLNYERQFNDKHAIITGLDLQTITSFYVVEFYPSIPIDSSEYLLSENPSHSYMLAIPLIYSFGKSFDRIRIGLELGIVNSFGIASANSQIITNYYGESTKYKWKTYPESGFFYCLDARLGVNFTYQFSDVFALGLTPYARLNIYTPNNYKSVFHNWNVNFALNFKYTFHSK